MAKKVRRKAKAKSKTKAKAIPTKKKKGITSNTPARAKKTSKPKAKPKPKTRKRTKKARSEAAVKGWSTRRRNQADLRADLRAEREAIQAELTVDKPLAERTKAEMASMILRMQKQIEILEVGMVIPSEYIRLKDGKASRYWSRMRLVPEGMKIHRKMKRDMRGIDPQSHAFIAYAKTLANEHDVTVREVYTFWFSP